jgi:hypothetical protein
MQKLIDWPVGDWLARQSFDVSDRRCISFLARKSKVISGSRRLRAGGRHEALQVLCVKSLRQDHPFARQEELVGRFLVSTQCLLQPVFFRGERLESGHIEIQAVVRQRCVVALPFVIRHRFVERAPAREAQADGVREERRVTQGIADAQRQIGVLVAARVPDQRPAGAEEFTQEIRQIGGPVEAFLAPSAANAR